MTTITAWRYHDFSAGHRVVGHENKCRYLHGHNYRIHFGCAADDLDVLGRVIDFSVIKSLLCEWLENNWDHKMILYCDDSIVESLINHESIALQGSVVTVPFNPTAENMGLYLLNEIGPQQLAGTGVELCEVIVEETRKCSVTVRRMK